MKNNRNLNGRDEHVSSTYGNVNTPNNNGHLNQEPEPESDEHLYNNNRNLINWSGAINSEHQTYAGYLKKQGALFKQWKERYFVLDSLKHQV